MDLTMVVLTMILYLLFLARASEKSDKTHSDEVWVHYLEEHKNTLDAHEIIQKQRCEIQYLKGRLGDMP